MSNMKIGIIGGGNMGEALIRGLCKDNSLKVYEIDNKKAQHLIKKYHVTLANIKFTLQSSQIIILAVKPQDMAAVLDEIKQYPSSGKLFISIAAGLTSSFFEKKLGSKARVIRTMPNMPALIGEGITAIAAGKYAKEADVKIAQKILRTIGDTVIVKESMIDAVTAVSGSGPAYVFLFVEQWMAAAKKLGFKDAQAKELVYKTLTGSAHLLEESEFDASTLRAKVTSKGGTTAAALDVFAKSKFDTMVKNALLAARNRAKQLSK